MKDFNLLGVSDTGKVVLTPSPQTVQGIQLLAQRVLVVLLTEYSGILRAYEGTSLITNIGSSNVISGHVSLLLSSAIASATDILKKDSYSNDPEELLDNIKLYNVTVDGDGVSFSIIVTSKAGDATTVTTPV